MSKTQGNIFKVRQAVGAIVYRDNYFLLVHKTKINTQTGTETIDGEWDFVKGGIEESDESPGHAILRELREETGSTDFSIMKQFDEKIHFEFPEKMKKKIGYERQETTMFLVEFTGSKCDLASVDEEIADLQFISENEVADKLTHEDTRSFFIKKLSQQSTK
ncbi:NUDIX hydrolase [Fredinandcohnia onubensis]|uniref:NUDIX hydrolase n=1 Tax=Fredinandcohnia onubensis TaxID=1571209 RepID=UPI000C0BDE9A|nr:NUDIX hydrolase [Fredinandcohnia onubensis]